MRKDGLAPIFGIEIIRSRIGGFSTRFSLRFKTGAKDRSKPGLQ
jgi:hypothetical protein